MTDFNTATYMYTCIKKIHCFMLDSNKTQVGFKSYSMHDSIYLPVVNKNNTPASLSLLKMKKNFWIALYTSNAKKKKNIQIWIY